MEGKLEHSLIGRTCRFERHIIGNSLFWHCSVTGVPSKPSTKVMEAQRSGIGRFDLLMLDIHERVSAQQVQIVPLLAWCEDYGHQPSGLNEPPLVPLGGFEGDSIHFQF